MKYKYKFYQDESFHDLSLTNKNNRLNFENDSTSTYFVNAILGIKVDKYKRKLEEDFRDLELKYANNKNVEFKGTSIKSKNFKFGIHSMDMKYVKFYNEFFDLLDKYNSIIYISTFNKFEQIIHNIFGFNMDKSFVYTFVKFLDRNKNSKLIELFFNEESTINEVLNEINNIINNFIKKNKHIKHLNEELNAARFIQFIVLDYVNTINLNEKYKFDYKYTFVGFHFLLEEINIPHNKSKLYLDGKGTRTEPMYKDAEELFKDINIKRGESKYIPGIRRADFLVNFIARIINNMDKELRSADKSKIFYFSKKWFELTEEKFDLYKKLGNMLKKRKHIYWTNHMGIYGDIIIAFYQFIFYFTKFDNFEKFNNITSREHTEKLNKCVRNKLVQKYDVI